MNLKPLVFAALAVCASSLASAQSAFAEFKLDVPPALALDASAAAGADTVGHWTNDNYFVGGANTSWKAGGEMQYDDGGWWHGLAAGAPFGQGVTDWSGSRSDEHGVTGKVEIQEGLIRTDVSLSKPELAVTGAFNTFWVRNFELKPHSSVSLSGLSSFSNSGSGLSEIDYGFHSASATLSSYNTGNAHVILRGSLEDQDVTTDRDVDASAFSYSTGPNGEMALTLTNSSDAVMNGVFTIMVEASATTIPAVPEPQTWLMIGVGALGIVVRKTRKRSATAA